MNYHYKATKVSLHVRKSNRGAIRLYEELLGYKVAGVSVEYYLDGEDAFVMEAQLPAVDTQVCSFCTFFFVLIPFFVVEHVRRLLFAAVDGPVCTRYLFLSLSAFLDAFFVEVELPAPRRQTGRHRIFKGLQVL